MTIFIYTLTDPRTNRVRYIGQSAYPLKRIEGHMSDARALAAYRAARPDYKGSPKAAWLLELLQAELKPRLNIIDICREGNPVEVEKLHIRSFMNRGCSLVNTYRLPSNGTPQER